MRVEQTPGWRALKVAIVEIRTGVQEGANARVPLHLNGAHQRSASVFVRPVDRGPSKHVAESQLDELAQGANRVLLLFPSLFLLQGAQAR